MTSQEASELLGYLLGFHASYHLNEELQCALKIAINCLEDKVPRLLTLDEANKLFSDNNPFDFPPISLYCEFKQDPNEWILRDRFYKLVVYLRLVGLCLCLEAYSMIDTIE